MDMPQLTKIINAAFIGAGMGTPARMDFDDETNTITVYAQELSLNALPPDPDTNIRMVRAAAEAIYQNTGVKLETGEGSEMGMVISYRVTQGHPDGICRTTPRPVLETAQMIMKQRGGDAPDRRRGRV
jgi:hypothetical protein